MYNYNCPDCNEAKLQSDKNARKINEVIDQVNALIQVNNETVDFIEEKANEKVEEVAEIKVNEVLGDLNTEIDNIQSSLDNIENDIYTALEYGELKLPSDFIEVPFNFYRDFDDKIKHNIDFDMYKKGTKVYVDYSATASVADGSEEKPFKTLKTAIQTIANGDDTEYVLICKSYKFDRNGCPEAFTLTNKKLSIIPYDSKSEILLTNHTLSLSWTQDGNAWKTSRTSVHEVFDLRQLDVYNLPIPLKHSETLDECNNNSNTWFTDGTNVWINTVDGQKPTDDNFIVGTGQNILAPTLVNSTLYIENCKIVGNHQATYTKFNGDINSTLILNDVKIVGGNSRFETTQSANTFNITNFKLIGLFNCKSAYGGLDGFNYHFQNIVESDRKNCLVIEYNCVSYKHGLNDKINVSNNATTCHEGVNILRIGTIGYETNGPVLADVDDCYSICIDCNIRDSISDNTSFCDTFKFAGSGSGKAILINCGSSGSRIYDLNSNIPTYLKKFKGSKIKYKDKINFI